MQSIDFLMEQRMGGAALKRAVSDAFHFPDERVCSIEDIEKFPEVDACDAVCHVQTFPEGFEAMVSLYYEGDEEMDMEFWRRLVMNLGVDCLFPSEEANPYQMVLLTTAGESKNVFLDVQKLDDEGLYVLDDA